MYNVVEPVYDTDMITKNLDHLDGRLLVDIPFDDSVALREAIYYGRATLYSSGFWGWLGFKRVKIIKDKR